MGIRTGKGTAIYQDGSKYKGDFKDGKRDGIGTFTYSNGDIYKGPWLKDMKNGEGGTFTHFNGKIIVGRWTRDRTNDESSKVIQQGDPDKQPIQPDPTGLEHASGADFEKEVDDYIRTGK